jgi:putative salt-induced outer membrane protein YdiY
MSFWDLTRSFLIFSFLVCSFGLGKVLANSSTQIFLSDSDQISVQDLELSNGTLRAHYFAGKLEIPWSRVRRIFLAEPYVLILQDGSRLVGKTSPIKNSEDFLHLIRNQGQSLALTHDEIKEMKTLKNFEKDKKSKISGSKPKIRQVWKGGADFGMILQSGNTKDAKLNYQFKASRQSEFDVFHINLSGTQGKSRSVETANSGLVGTRFDLKLRGNRHYFLLSELSYDKPKGIELRSVLGFGAGRTIYDRGSKYLQVSFGLGAEKEQREDDSRISSITGLFELDLKHPLAHKTYLTGLFKLYPNIKEWADHLRGEASISLVSPLTAKSSLKITLQERFQENVGPNVEKLDLTLTTSLAYSF